MYDVAALLREWFKELIKVVRGTRRSLWHLIVFLEESEQIVGLAFIKIQIAFVSQSDVKGNHAVDVEFFKIFGAKIAPRVGGNDDLVCHKLRPSSREFVCG